MKVEIWLHKNNVAISYDGAAAVYQKGDLVCIGYEDKTLRKAVDKYPIGDIFKIRETSFVSSQPCGVNA